MRELVLAPSINLVAHTVIDDRGLQNWAEQHDLAEVLHDDETPLGHLWSEVYSDGNAAEVSIDALPEFGGRFCYRAFKKGRERPEYIRNIVEMEHGSVLEHSVVSFAITGVSRSLSHELVRHRAGTGISQESQRYVEANDIRFVVPPLILAMADANLLVDFRQDCLSALRNYEKWQRTLGGLTSDRKPDFEIGVKLDTMRKKRINEASRALLPNAAETRMVWTMNMRAARHVCALRGAPGADLEIRRLAVGMTVFLKNYAPLIFGDFDIYTADDGFESVKSSHPKV